MPRPKRSQMKKGNDYSVNTTIMDMTSEPLGKNRGMKLRMWKAEVKDRMKNARSNLNNMHKEKVKLFECVYKNLLLSIPKSQLDVVIDINDGKFRASFLDLEKNEIDENKPLIPAPPVSRATGRRRSRSASNVKLSVRASQRIRSSSVDVFKTPSRNQGLSSIMSSRKYTVTKPKKVKSSGVHVKRIMKPDEEAISTCGSPLYVPACTLVAPHCNIPLPGGVVLNIEPKEPKSPLDIPLLDEKTKNQIKILRDHLNKLV